MLVNVELYADPTKPDEPYKITVDLNPNNPVMVRSHRGSDYARLPERPDGKLIIRLFPEPTKGPPAPPMAVLTDVSPDSVSMAAGSTPMTLTGTDFMLASTTVYVNNVFVPSTRVNDTTITFNYAPQSLGTCNVKVMQNSVFTNTLTFEAVA